MVGTLGRKKEKKELIKLRKRLLNDVTIFKIRSNANRNYTDITYNTWGTTDEIIERFQWALSLVNNELADLEIEEIRRSAVRRMASVAQT